MNLCLASASTVGALPGYLPPQPVQTSEEGKILAELGPYDILLGRGTGPNENQGNVRFRELLKATMAKYEHSHTSNHGGVASALKLQISKEVLNLIRAMDGHFVRKLGKEENRMLCAAAFPGLDRKQAEKKQLYVVVSQAMAMEKTKQSIRFQINKDEKNKKSGSKSKEAMLAAQDKKTLPKEDKKDSKKVILLDSAPSTTCNATQLAALQIAAGKPLSSATTPSLLPPATSRMFKSIGSHSTLEDKSKTTSGATSVSALLGNVTSGADLIQWSNRTSLVEKHQAAAQRELVAAQVQHVLAMTDPNARNSTVGDALSSIVGAERRNSNATAGDALSSILGGDRRITDEASVLAAAESLLRAQKQQQILQEALLLLPSAPDSATTTNSSSSLLAETAALLRLQAALAGGGGTANAAPSPAASTLEQLNRAGLYH